MRSIAFLLVFLLTASCQPQKSDVFHGYVEGEFVMVAPTSSGILKTLSVQRGDSIKTGDSLFALDLINQTAARDAAQANLDRAQAQLEDLKKGARPAELAVIEGQLEQAAAALAYAEKEYNRIKPLAEKSAESQSSLDKAKSNYDSALAQVKELKARLAASELTARSDQIIAAEAATNTAQQALVQAQKTMDDAAPKAPANSYVDDTYYKPGEFIPAGQPVVSLLAPDNIKARFFVPQATLPKFHPGQPVTINCDGCDAPIKGRISYIASQAEYTPPVIYSVESRDKLVFMIEAVPDQPGMKLRPGLPVDITVEFSPPGPS